LVPEDWDGIHPHSDIVEKFFIRRCPRRQQFKIRQAIITTKYKISGILPFKINQTLATELPKRFFSFFPRTKTVNTTLQKAYKNTV
jgi:hypothetical protein